MLLKNVLNILLFVFVLGSIHKAAAQHLHLTIKSRDSSETRKIDSAGHQTRFTTYEKLQTATDRLLKKFQKKGYVQASLNIRKKNDTVFTALFSLRKKYKYVKIFYGKTSVKLIGLAKISPKITPSYFTLPFSNLEKNMVFLNNQLANQGKPFNYLQLSNIRSAQTDTLKATLTMNHSKKRVINTIIIKGYKKFPKAFIKNFIGLKKGEVFNKKVLDKKVTRLKNLRFANSTHPPEVLFTKDSTSIYLYLKKRSSNLFDGFLGFATQKETNKLELNGNLNVQLINNLNYGERLHLHYKNDGGQQQRFQAEITLPYLFKSPIGIEAGLDLFRKDSTYTTNSQSFKMTYQLSSQLKLNTGYSASSSNNLTTDTTSQTLTESFQGNYFTLGGDFQILHEYQAMAPFKTKLGIELSTGTRKGEQDESRQWIAYFNGSHIFQLNPRNSVFIHNQTGYLESDDYLTNELFIFGGINSLRGFEENSLLASFYSTLQTEYRYLLSPSLYAHSIFDAGYAENQTTHQQQHLFGLGFGLGLKTKAGLLKVDFADGKVNDQPFAFKNTQVHLSLIAVF